MEKDIGKVKKNENTEIVVRIDDFGGKPGVTIREFVTSDRYTGFTKAGTRISPDNFLKFRELINQIDISELNAMGSEENKESENTESSEDKEENSQEDY